MSVCRKLPDGTIQKIAGHTILLDANASEVRQGRWHLQSTAPEWVVQNIIFTDPMPDNDYIVIIESDNQSWATQPGPYRITNKTTTGFTLASCNMATASMDITGTYTAFKPVKIEGYTALQNKVNNPDDTPTIDSMNLVTSDGVARAIENASAVWKGTRAEWNALPAADKKKYDLAMLLDKTLVKAVDREDGTETDVANLNKIVQLTEAEYDAMPSHDPDTYYMITDDTTTMSPRYPKPDWANAVSITLDQIKAGYTAPSDGMFVGICGAPAAGGSSITTINNVVVAQANHVVNNYYNDNSINTVVSKGDVIKCSTTASQLFNMKVSFVPWK